MTSESETKPSSSAEEASSTTNTDYTKQVDESLRNGIKSVVNTTNSTLASLEHTTNVTSTTFVSQLTSLSHQLKYVFNRASFTYNNRQTYGIPIIAGSASSLPNPLGMMGTHHLAISHITP